MKTVYVQFYNNALGDYSGRPYVFNDYVGCSAGEIVVVDTKSYGYQVARVTNTKNVEGNNYATMPVICKVEDKYIKQNLNNKLEELKRKVQSRISAISNNNYETLLNMLMAYDYDGASLYVETKDIIKALKKYQGVVHVEG